MDISFPLNRVQLADAVAITELLLGPLAPSLEEIPGAVALKPAFLAHSQTLQRLFPQEAQAAEGAKALVALLSGLDDAFDRCSMGAERLLEALMILRPDPALSLLNARLNLHGLAGRSYNEEVMVSTSLDARLLPEDWALMETLPGSTRDRTFKMEIEALKAAGVALGQGLQQRSGQEAVAPVSRSDARAALHAWRATFKALKALLVAAPESSGKAQLVRSLNVEFERIKSRA